MNNDRLYIKKPNAEKVELEIDNSKDVEITYAIPQPEQLGIALSDVSQHIHLIDTAKNRNALGNISNPNVENEYRSKVIDAVLETDIETMNGQLKISNSNVNQKHTNHKAIFKTGNVNWTNLAKSTYINQLDLGIEQYLQSRVQSVFQNNSPYNGTDKVWYSLKDYGQTGTVYGLDADTTIAILPDVYAKAVIDAFEQISGYTFNCPFFETDYFKNIIHPFTSGLSNIEIDETFIATLKSELRLDIITREDGNGNLRFLVQSGASNITYSNPLTGYTIYNSSINTSYIITITYDLNTLISGFLYIETNTGRILNVPLTGNSGTLAIDFQAFKNEEIFFSSDNSMVFNSLDIEIKPAKSEFPFQNGISYKVASILPKTSFSDYLKGFISLFGLIVVTDNETNTVFIHPFSDVKLPTGETIQGFYKNKVFADDWSSIVTNARDVQYNESNQRYIQFQFKEDSNDKLFADNKTPYAETVDLETGNTDTRTIQNPVFGPTLNKYKDFLYMPTFRGEENDSYPSFAFELRILYKLGNIDGDFDWMINGNTLNQYPYATQVDGRFGRSVNLGYSVDAFNTENLSIINIFHTERLEYMSDKVSWSYDVYLNENHTKNKIELFRKPKFIDGQYYILVRCERLNVSKSRGMVRCYFRKK